MILTYDVMTCLMMRMMGALTLKFDRATRPFLKFDPKVGRRRTTKIKNLVVLVIILVVLILLPYYMYYVVLVLILLFLLVRER